jgi:hypothetical protein
MAEEAYAGRITRETTFVFDDRCRALFDGVNEFATSVMAMNAATQGVAPDDIRACGRAHSVAGDPQ